MDLLESSILSWTFLVFLSKVWCIWTVDLEDHTELSFGQLISVFPNSDVDTLDHACWPKKLIFQNVVSPPWTCFLLSLLLLLFLFIIIYHYFRTLFLHHGRVSYGSQEEDHHFPRCQRDNDRGKIIIVPGEISEPLLQKKSNRIYPCFWK